MGYYEQEITNAAPRGTGWSRTEAYPKGVTWFPGRTALEVETVVWGVYVRDNGQEVRLSNFDRKQFRDLCNALGPERAWIEVERIMHKVPACPWCGSRPQLIDYDCDGPYRIADCGSDQCGGPSGIELKIRETA